MNTCAQNLLKLSMLRWKKGRNVYFFIKKKFEGIGSKTWTTTGLFLFRELRKRFVIYEEEAITYLTLSPAAGGPIGHTLI
jgi:hypothetical protein